MLIQLQRVHSESKSSDVKAFTEAEEPAQLLCDHLDHILMHGLREFEDGYWPFVRHFTRNELVQRIRQLKRVTTSVGRGEGSGSNTTRWRKWDGGRGQKDEEKKSEVTARLNQENNVHMKVYQKLVGTGGLYQPIQSYMCKQGSYMSFA